MRRRRRALGLLVLALLSALVAATLASSYGESLAGRFGALRPVVVAAVDLPAGRALTPAELKRTLAVRRVPARFVPPSALSTPADAAGRVPVAPVPAGAYLLAAQLRLPRSRGASVSQLGTGRRPVQIAVSGGSALGRGGRAGARVDVMVTTEPAGGGPGRTYVAAHAVELLGLEQSPGTTSGAGSGAPADWLATLALTRSEAIELIEAQNFARQVQLIPSLPTDSAQP